MQDESKHVKHIKKLYNKPLLCKLFTHYIICSKRMYELYLFDRKQ